MSGHTAPGFHALRKHKIHRYGWRREIPDAVQDQWLKISTPSSMPTQMNVFATHNPPTYDQGQAGSCTGNGTGCAFQYERMRQGLADWIPSRLFIYYGARYYEGTTDEDAGAEIRDAVKVVAKLGAPPEKDWPYDIDRVTVKPSRESYKDALNNQVLKYYRVSQNLQIMKSCLVAGFPIIIGFTVYESFESAQVAQDGIVPMPKANEDRLGGHCVVVYGYDDASNRFRCRNSWGTEWGDNGNFTMPYQYLTNANLASDFWTIRLVEASV
jgi:C1A family cysteine protease